MRLLPVLAVAAALAASARPAAAAPAPVPALGSPYAVVIDVDSGTDLVATGADELRPIASMTKIFVALVLERHGLDLDRWTEITKVDADAAVGGATSRLNRAETFRNRDLLHAMLLVSDNRTPTSLARSVGLSASALIVELNALATELGLTHTHFDDATGISGNQSTPRELATALALALRDPVLRRVMSTRAYHFVSQSGKIAVDVMSTVRPLWHRTAEVVGGKTGHTTQAGYCMAVEAVLGGRTVVMAFMGSADKSFRYLDFATVAEWLEPAPPARVAAR